MKKTNSKANCNVLFRPPKGHESHAQITAFEDLALGRASRGRIQRANPSAEYGRGGDDERAAPFPRRERHDGLPHHDGESAAGTTSSVEAHRLALSALRPNRESLFEGCVGWSFWERTLQE